MPNLTAEHQNLRLGSPKIPLWHVNATNLAIGQQWYFTNQLMPDGSLVKFNGINYMFVPHTFDGIKEDTSKLYMDVTLIISDVGRVFSSILQGRSLANADVTFMEVYARNLDSGTHPNPNKHTEPISLVVDRMAEGRWGQTIAYALNSPLSAPHLKIPGKQYTEKDFPAIGRTTTR